MARIPRTIKNLNNPNAHDSVVTYLEPDILECEVKWALGSISLNIAGLELAIFVPAELFKIPMMLLKCCTQYASKFGKLSSEHRTGKHHFSFQFQRRSIAKNIHICTIALISHASKVMLKILQAKLQQFVNQKLPDVQAGLRKGRGTRDQISNISWIIEKAREFHENIYFCFIDYTEAFDCVDHNKLWKILKEMGIPDHLTCLLRNLYAGQETAVGTQHGKWTGSKLGNEYAKPVYCHPA